MRALCRLVTCTLVTCTGLAAQQDQPAPLSKSMEDLARAFKQLEQGLGAKAPLAGLRPAGTRLLEVMRGVQQRAGDGRLAQRAGHGVAAAEVLVEQLQAETAAGARIALEGLRRRCIACHVVRTDKPQSQYPARRNTVWGRVELRGRGGERLDRAADLVMFVNHIAEAAPVTPAYLPSISQKGQTFSPHVLPVVKGTKVAFPNDDRLFHNVFSLSKTHNFDLGIYGQGKVKDTTFDKTGLVRVFCHIHANMSANILVLQNPAFAVTDPDGLFVITDIPDGEINLRCWHEFGGGAAHRFKLDLKGGELRRVDLKVQEAKKKLPHKNKHGRPYRSKY